MSEAKHVFGEAFNLMRYRDRVTGEIEILWNSRNGVTPFIIDSRRGNEAEHVDWQKDVKDPTFKPSKGMRIFVDAQPDQPHIIESARQYVEKYWDDGSKYPMKEALSGQCSTKEEAVAFFIADWTKPGSPTVIEVI